MSIIGKEKHFFTYIRVNYISDTRFWYVYQKTKRHGTIPKIK